MANASTDARLRQVFTFDADDLAANHIGRLTARQETAVNAVFAARRLGMMISWGVVGLAILLSVSLVSVLDIPALRTRQWPIFIPIATHHPVG